MRGLRGPQHRRECVAEVVERNCRLIARSQVLDRGRLSSQFVSTEDHCHGDALAVGQFQLIADTAMWLQRKINAEPLAAQLTGEASPRAN